MDGLVADLIIGQNRLVEQVTILSDKVEQLVGFQRQTVESQSHMVMQLSGIHDFMRRMAGDFQELKADNRRLNDLETRVFTLESIVLKAS